MAKHLLFAVLNWGLGHATRSTPVITALLKKGFKVTLASDGLSLYYLKKQFPALPFVELHPLRITYGHGSNQTLALVKKGASYIQWYREEKAMADKLIKDGDFSGIISDNRPTVCSNKFPSIYITHQVQVKAGLFSKAASALHHKTIKNYNEIWVPDFSEHPGISGDLGHTEIKAQKRFIGPLSSLVNIDTCSNKFDVGIILSGPEPQRTLLENELVKQLGRTNLRIKLNRGTIKDPETPLPATWEVVHLADLSEVQATYSNAQVIIARNGYSTLMDLAVCPKPALLIPTPGQPEQEYLAQMHSHQGIYAIQNQQNLDVLNGLEVAKTKFSNQQKTDFSPDWDELFSIF